MNYLVEHPEVGTIQYARSNKAKRIIISVKPQFVRVAIPKRQSFKNAQKFVESKLAWIKTNKQSMDLQFKRQSSFGLKDNDIDVKDYEINNDGDIWVTGKVKGNSKIYKLPCEKEFEELAFYPEKYVSEKYSSI